MDQSAAQSSTPTTVLLVDDEQNILTSLRRLFRQDGYNILMANNGRAALDVLRSQPVDLVISDMRMPEMDGAELLEQVVLHWPDTVRILLTGFADLSSAVNAINKGKIYKYVNKPWEDNDLRLTVKQALERKFLEQERNRLLELTNRQNEQLKELNASLEQKVRQRTQQLQDANSELKSTHDKLKQNYVASIKVFSSLVEMREGNRRGHARRVADQVRQLAINLGMQQSAAQDVMFAGLLHDLGELTLSDKLLATPNRAMSPEERAQFAKHCLIGEAALVALEPLREAAKYIRSHHECYDGSGFPDGLAREDIPLGARILTVVSDYDDLQTGAMFTQRLEPADARAFLSRARGRLYDPRVVDAFLAHFEQEAPRTGERMVALSPAQLAPGMTVARDLYLNEGILLLAEGYLLDERMVERLKNYEKNFGHELLLYVFENARPGAQ